jgi:hypothetical protein
MTRPIVFISHFAIKAGTAIAVPSAGLRGDLVSA